MCGYTRKISKKRIDSCGTYTSAYVSKRKETISLAKKNHALDRALEMEIPEEVYTKLLEYVDE